MSQNGSPAQQSKAAKLRRAARPLKPSRSPYYVQHATPTEPLTGWWWQPAGATDAVPLAASYDRALVTLAHMTNTQKVAA